MVGVPAGGQLRLHYGGTFFHLLPGRLLFQELHRLLHTQVDEFRSDFAVCGHLRLPFSVSMNHISVAKRIFP